MYRDHTVGVVVPAYNEEGFVGEVIDTMPEFVDRIYPVDDRSTDGTWAEIREHAAAANARGDPETDGGSAAVVAPGDGEAVTRPDEAATDRVVPIRNPENRGVGGTVVTGYRRALEDGVDVVAVMNGDGQMDPDVLDEILDPVVEGRAGFAKGNRLGTVDDRAKMPLWRTFGNSLLTVLTRMASGYWEMTDPMDGYTAISREALASIDLDAVYTDFGFCNDMLAKLGRHDVDVVDVPHAAEYGDEESSISYRRFITTVSPLLARHYFDRLQRDYVVEEFHPLVLLYPFGALVGGAGLVSALRDEDGNPVVLLALSAFAVLLATVLDREADR